ncbi:MAG: cytochrome c [Dehalococcoidia bacterium]
MNRKQLLLLSVLLLLVVLVAAACRPGDPGRSTGAYPIEILPEMHYSQSFRSQEGPRLLPPENSVPVSGSQASVGSHEEEQDRENPLEPTAETLEHGALLVARDCAICHGGTPDGGGVGEAFVRHGAPQPPAFSSDRIQSLTPGEKFSSISNGPGFMPPFINLLSEEQRWAIITLIEAPEADRNALLEAASGLSREDRFLRLLELENR